MATKNEKSWFNAMFHSVAQMLKVPTCRKMVELYLQIAKEESRLTGGFPSKATIKNNVISFIRAVKCCGIDWRSGYTALTKERLEAFHERMAKKKSQITAYSYIMGLRGITAKWTLRRYMRRGYYVKEIELPWLRKIKGQRYERPSRRAVEEVKRIYRELAEKQDKRYWLMYALMLQFAMRNGDVKRATREIFQKRKDRWYLVYTPNKTRFSSGRKVVWPIHEEVWRRIKKAIKGRRRKQKLIKGISYVERKLNKIIRTRIEEFSGKKALYELRKMRIDAEYRHHGIEHAIALSGDDYRTIQRYYAEVGDLMIKAEEPI